MFGFRVSTTFDLLTVVPALLGFVPEDDVVTVVVKDGRACLSTRLDLNLPPKIAEEQAAFVADAVTRTDADMVLLVRYCTTTDDEAHIGDSIALHLSCDGVPIVADLTVRGSQIEGTAVYTHAGDATVHAAPTLADLPDGLSARVARTRDEVARSIEPGSRAATVSALVAALRAKTPAPDAATLLRVLTEPVATVSDADVAAAVHALADVDVLNRVMTAQPVDAPTIDHVSGMRARLLADATRVERFTELAACLTDDEAAPVLSCLLVTAYAHGLGALVNITSERLQRTRTHRHPLVEWVEELAHAGSDPARTLP